MPKKKTPSKNKKGVTNKTEQLKKAAVTALYQYRGNVSAACSAIGIGRTQFYAWKNEDSDFCSAVENVVEFQIDKVESKLLELIDAGDTTAVIFYLKTIGKRRGYVEKTQTDITSNGKEIATGKPAILNFDGKSIEIVS